MLANKVLDDHSKFFFLFFSSHGNKIASCAIERANCADRAPPFYFVAYTAKTWSEVSRLDLQPLVAGEMELLRGLDFKCHITSDEFGRWLKTLAVQVANRKLKQVSLQYRKQMESRRGSLQLPSPDQLFFLPPLATFSPPLPPYSAAVYNTPPESSSSTFPGSYLARPINTNQRIHSTPLSRSQSNSSPLPTPSAPLIRQEPVMSSSNYSVSSPAYAPSLKRPASAETCEPQPLRRINHIFRSQSTTASTLLPALPPFALPHSHHRHHPSSLFHFSTLSNGISPLNLPPYYSTHSSVAASQYSSSSENSGRHVNRVRPDTEERLAVFASSNPLPSPKSVEGCLGGQENAEEEDEDVFAYSVSPGPKHSHHQHNSIAGVSSTRRQSISYFPPQPHQLQQVQHRQHYGYLPHEIPITTHHPTPAPSPIYSRR